MRSSQVMQNRFAMIAALVVVALVAFVVIRGCGSSDSGSDTGATGSAQQPKSGTNNPESDPLQHVTQGGAEVKQGCKTAKSSGSSFTCTESGGKGK